MSRPKFCPKCGNPLEDAGKFCGKCGTPIVDTDEALNAAQNAPQQAPQPVPMPQQAPDQQQPPQGFAQPQPGYQQGAVPPPPPPKPPKDPNKTVGAFVKRHKLPLILGCAAAVLIAAGLIVFFQLTKYQKIDAQKLFAFSFKGINGSGTAVGYLNCSAADPDPYSYERDENGNAIEKEYSDYFATDKKTLLKVYDKASDNAEAVEMRNALLAKSKGEYDLKVKLSKTSGISNGDKISCTVEFDEEELKEALIKLENTEFEIEAEGLVDGEKIDLFDGFTPVFTGMDEKGQLDYESMKGTWPFVSYYLSSGSSYDLKNGDTLTIQASFSSYDVENFNYIDQSSYSGPAYFNYNGKTYLVDDTSAEKQFTVSGLSEAAKIDVFEKIKFETTGAAPYLRISRVNTDDLDEKVKNAVSYSLDLGDKSTFKAGDKFTVKAYVSDRLLEAGYKPTDQLDESSYCYREFTVDDSYGHYVTEKTEPSEMDAFKDKFAEFTKKFQDDYAGKSYLGGISLDGTIKSIDTLDLERDYIVLNDGFYEGTIGTYDAKTYLYRFYKVGMTVTQKDEETDEEKNVKKTIYAAFRFSGPYIDANGEAQLESNFVSITVAEKAAELKKATVDKVTDGKAYELGKAAAAAPDDSSKKADNSSKKDEDSSKKDDSEKAEDSSSEAADDTSGEAEEVPTDVNAEA